MRLRNISVTASLKYLTLPLNEAREESLPPFGVKILRKKVRFVGLRMLWSIGWARWAMILRMSLWPMDWRIIGH